MSSAWNNLKNNISITELPHYAINQSLPEDTFFTDHGIAQKCFSQFEKVAKKYKINLKDYFFVEPSSGDGCFYDLLPENRRKALDIIPRKSYVEKADFLKWYPKDNKKYIVIGNPPFGVRGAYALAFIKRAFLFADVVAFILPMSFYTNGKGSNMLRVENANLLFSEKLPSQSFYMPDKEGIVSINTVFQVWQKGTKNKPVFNDYDVSEYVDIFTVCSSPDRLCGMHKIKDTDCFIASTFYRDNIQIVKTFEEVKYGSGYGIILKKDKQKIKSLLKNANWSKYSSDATNHCKHIRMSIIKRVLGEAGFGKKI
jgi:hypothetical protein